jgi:alpha-2-macroglobulin
MKLFNKPLSVAALLVFAFSATIASASFDGAIPEPQGLVQEAPTQLRIRFPEQMVKEAKTEPFTVSCKPAMQGFASWADSNTLWTFDFKSDDWRPRPAGGSKCQITQTADISAASGKVWKAGTINYSVVVDGPNVKSVVTGNTFRNTLRENNPVLLITFDGPVDEARFFADQAAYLSYTSSNAPGEKIPLVALPQDQQEKVRQLFNESNSTIEVNSKRWILATANQNLIPEADMRLTIERQVSAENSDVIAQKKHTQDFSVRGNFLAQVLCSNESAITGVCMPNSPINVDLNGMVKWADIKDAYIEYVPYKSTDSIPVRSYAEIPENKKVGFWDWFIDSLSELFPFLAKYSDTVVNQIVFNVNIEPLTVAKVIIPQGLRDLDGRTMANALAEFPVRIAALSEFLRLPQKMAFFEKNVSHLYLPVGIVNQNQKIFVRQTGAQNWEPVREFPKMIQAIRAYSGHEEYRSTKEYTSPMVLAGITSKQNEQILTGPKNRPNVLQFPFGENRKSGLYGIEVSSPTLEESLSDEKEERFYNPKFSLAQVTDISVHLKKGKDVTLAWVTQLSTGQSIPNAQLEVFNCMGEKKLSLKTGATGLVQFANEVWATDCGAPEGIYSEYLTPESFYVGVKSGDDLALLHSSWSSSSAYAFSAPGMEWFDSEIRENEPNFHAIIGVNLVKPGQKVPVEIVAKIPDASGFREVAPAQLPDTARLTNSDDEETFFELPLSWKNGRAEFLWQVPNNETTKLGQYNITLTSKRDENMAYSAGNVEVAEFKIPLMSGIVGMPNQELVLPDSIPVGSVIRYANGVGAKNLGAEISYYFSPTNVENKDLPGFIFGSGPVSATGNDNSLERTGLPSEERPGVIEGLKTGSDGSLSRDLGQEKVADGRSIVDTIKTVSRPQRLVVRVRYQDQMGEFQTISRAKNIYNAASYVGTKVASGPRSSARLQAALVDVQGNINSNMENLELKVLRIETKVVGEELFGGLIKNTLEREIKAVRWEENCNLSNKVVSCPVGALKEGSYAFQVLDKTSKQVAHNLFKVDSEGRVYGPNEYMNFGDDEGNKQLPLALDKKSYEDGQKAVVSFAAPFRSCSALVTIERTNVMESFVVPNACEQGKVEVTAKANQAPNAFVSVYAVTGRAADSTVNVGELDLGRPTYRIGFANMLVNWGRFQSNVEVKTEKEKYQPGETVNVTVKVAPAQGQLKNGTVTLIALEEKILELKENKTYDVLAALMQMRYHGVETITALERIETVTGEDNADLPANSPRKGGDEGGDGTSNQEFKRKLFDALVAFQTNVPVVNGVARASFKANDSLTRFRVIAIALDASQKFGMGTTNYLSEKDTQVFANLPSVGYTGDKFPAKVTVQNNSANDGKFRAEIVVTVRDANGNIIETKTLSKEAQIEKNGSVAIEVGDLEVGDNAGRIDYVVRIYDEQGKLVDVMEPAPQVILPAVPLAIRDTLLAQMDGSSLNQTLVKDPSALPGKGRIQVVASKSLVSSAINNISQRLERDQFADFFIPSRFARAFLRSSEKQPQEIKAVLEALPGFTDSEGYVKYFPQSRTGSVFLTAYLMNSLQQEPWAAALMPTALKERIKGGVEKVLTKKADPIYIGRTPMDWMRAQTVMARAAFTFGDQELNKVATAVMNSILDEVRRNPAPFGQPLDKWTNRDLSELWLLEVAVGADKANQSVVLKQLTGAARLVYAGNSARLNGSPSMGSFYSDETIESSGLLMGIGKAKGDRNLAKALALGIVNANTKGWYNATTMLNVAQGLKAFGRAFENEVVSGVLTIEVPEERATGTVDFRSKSVGGITTNWTSDKATVQFRLSGQGKPWVSVQGLSAVPLKAPVGQGLSLERSVRNLNRDDGFQAGDVIEVTINLSSGSVARHIALTDPIPAGSNIIGEAYGDYSSGQKSYSGYKLYFDFLPNGTATVKYQYQLNNPGTFQLPPTRAEGLFMPSLFAETPNASVSVK